MSGEINRQKKQVEDLQVWQRSMNLSVEVYRAFAGSKDFGLRDQVRRCSVSIPSNIAEGFERGGPREFARFLKIAKGSCGELRTQLQLASRVGELEAEKANPMISECIELSRMLQGLIRSTGVAEDEAAYIAD